MGTDLKRLRKRAEKAKMATMQQHVFVCTASDCKSGKDVAKTLKHGIANAGLRAELTVTKTTCMNICKGGGSVVVVYPDGVWYGGVDTGLAKRIVAEHLVGGSPVEDATFLSNPLSR
ncbi:(2Fe-2S) ferredoxin domain-containing protein [Euzebya tangerina]|uniref:(2Fe-2S) ferredoxin domain-containing protein n=1 Tax=Euzebya tangerina TaxID=591198 RepID=UPI000E31CB17|nr:hypothetical protein [Euzebya tangerina]